MPVLSTCTIPDSMRYPEAAAYLGMHKVTLWKLTKAGHIRCVRASRGHKRGGKGVPVIFFKRDLDAYLDKTANVPRPR